MNLLPLRAGDLTMVVDVKSGFLRHIRLRESEVVRGIYAAVRDQNWQTVPTVISKLIIKTSKNSFHLAFDATCRQGKIDFRWKGKISGTSQGKVTFSFDGEAHSTFERNRIGICVLHPLKECRGARARVVQTNGAKRSIRFSERIDPQIRGKPRFGDMRSLAWEVSPRVWAELHFVGDAFEMEDQRNWSDASFKTYCTPLALPFPVRILPGTRVRQRVTLSVSGRHVRHRHSTSSDLIQLPRQAIGELPQIGLSATSPARPLGASEIKHLKALQLAHLRVDVRFGQSDWKRELAWAKSDAQKLGAKLELAIHIPNDDCARELRDLSKLPRKRIARVLVFRQGEEATSLETLRLCRRFFSVPGVPIGGGSDAHFCELNRGAALGRFAASKCSFVSWPITPQVHAFDDLTLIENIEAQSDMVISGRRIAGKPALIVSPITLRPRFNAVAADSRLPVSPRETLPEADLRQASLITAAWTLGSIVSLASQDVSSLTFFETTGPRGVMKSLAEAHSEKRLPSNPATLFPVYYVFAAMAGYRRIAPVYVPAVDRLAVMALFGRRALRRVVFANLRSEAASVRFALPAKQGSLHLLNETNLTQAAVNPKCILQEKEQSVKLPRNIFETVLEPYALGILDLG
jgi:hypothetical protein